ncbi:PQQ-dependent sugar dehydrogenase [Aurantimonas endophytica]|uniref:Glucose/arabinose dehydrogenase n=1 Tax=Aurantimonas endophytica TaxID=1522175 RepID=A0A7W6MS22_9HYPH|nr:PQQ-dependent sugar dehydrogenase [Aurantimonas endophytica]MBB4005583.1 glucose/arabinose dehydrogenase [Aurantimonas endophytica]MCO6406451.1 PQQ-dependent sugar dehydrogenase [Aurantimonas endophytica]
MKDRGIDRTASAGNTLAKAPGKDGCDVAPVRASTTIALAFAMLGLSISSGAHAQLSRSEGSPISCVIPAGDPTEIVSELNIPWSAVRVGSEVLVSQRGTGEILAFLPGEGLSSVGTVPDVVARGDGGMLGLAVLEENGNVWLYGYHSATSGNRIVRMAYSEGELGEAQLVLDGVPGGRGHNGGRIAFGPDGMLYATVGETRNPNLSQDPSSLAGKILRMTPTGGVPTDNPIEGSLVYSLGLRNSQGLAWDDRGQLWATDFGDDAWDEFNRIEPGGNYGWPVVEGVGGNPAYVDPVMQWRTQEMGPSGLAYIDGTFFIAGLTGQRLWSLTIDAAGNPHASAHYVGEYGRVRDVLAGSDGSLWFLTNGRRGAPGGEILSVSLTRLAASECSRASAADNSGGAPTRGR